MKEDVFKYLSGARTPVSAQELVRLILGIQGANPMTAAKIIRTLVAQDLRFREDEPGFWSLAPIASIESAHELANDWICEFFPQSAKSIQEIRSARIYPVPETDSRQFEIDNASLEQFARAITKILDQHAEQILFVSGFGRARTFINQLEFIARQKMPKRDLISIRLLAQRLYPNQSFPTFDKLCQFFQKVHRFSEEPAVFMAELRHISQCLIQELKSRGLTTKAEIMNFCYPPTPDIDFSKYGFDRHFLDQLPPQPGVYIMKDRQDQVIYVGKAKNLSRRLKSYFSLRQRPDTKAQSILERVFAIDIELVGSELEALLREFALIQQYQPDINRQIKIHNRKIPSRFYRERIFILPALSPNQVSLVFLARSGATRQVFIDRIQPDEQELNHEIEAFFYLSKAPDRTPNPDGMILLSWLRQNAEKVNWVEIEMAENRDDVMRQVLLHIQFFKPNGEKTIFR